MEGITRTGGKRLNERALMRECRSLTSTRQVAVCTIHGQDRQAGETDGCSLGETVERERMRRQGKSDRGEGAGYFQEFSSRRGGVQMTVTGRQGELEVVSWKRKQEMGGSGRRTTAVV